MKGATLSLLPVPVGVYRTCTPLGEVAAACAWCEDWTRFSLVRTRRTAHVALLPTRLRWDLVVATCESCRCAVETVEEGWDPAPPGERTLDELLARTPEDARTHGAAMLDRLAEARLPGAAADDRRGAMAEVLNVQSLRMAPIAARRAWVWRCALVLVLLLATAGAIGGVLGVAGFRGTWVQSSVGSVVTVAGILAAIAGAMFAIERRTSRRFARAIGDRLAGFRPTDDELRALWRHERREPLSPARVVWLRHLRAAAAPRREASAGEF